MYDKRNKRLEVADDAPKLLKKINLINSINPANPRYNPTFLVSGTIFPRFLTIFTQNNNASGPIY